MSERLDERAQLCVFALGPMELALDLMRVEEILPPLPVTPVPGGHGALEGVVHLRGAVLPVMDLRKQLRSGAPPPKLKPKLMVALLGRRRLGLLVDGVLEVVRLAKSELKPAPDWLPGAAMPHIIGVFGSPEKLRLLLDLKSLVTDSASQNLSQRFPERLQ